MVILSTSNMERFFILKSLKQAMARPDSLGKRIRSQFSRVQIYWIKNVSVTKRLDSATAMTKIRKQTKLKRRVQRSQRPIWAMLCAFQNVNTPKSALAVGLMWRRSRRLIPVWRSIVNLSVILLLSILLLSKVIKWTRELAQDILLKRLNKLTTQVISQTVRDYRW